MNEFENVFMSQENIKALFGAIKNKVQKEYGESIPNSFISKQIDIMKQKLIQFIPDNNKNTLDNIRIANSEIIPELYRNYTNQIDYRNIPINQPITNLLQNMSELPPPIATKEEKPTVIPTELQTISVKKGSDNSVEDKFAELSSMYSQQPTQTNKKVSFDISDEQQPEYQEQNEKKLSFNITNEEPTEIQQSQPELVNIMSEFLNTQRDIQENILNEFRQMKLLMEKPKQQQQIMGNLSVSVKNGLCILPKQVDKIISIELVGGVFPPSQYLINPKNDTILVNDEKIIFEHGNYTFEEFIDTLKEKLNANVEYIKRTNKIKITYENTVKINFGKLGKLIGFYEEKEGTEFISDKVIQFEPEKSTEIYISNINKALPFGKLYFNNIKPIKKIFGRDIGEFDSLDITFDYYPNTDWELDFEIIYVI